MLLEISSVDRLKKKVIFGNAHNIYRRQNETYEKKNNLPKAKHFRGSIILSGVTASATEGLDRFRGGMKSEHYQGILQQNLLPSVQKLGLSRRSWVRSADNNASHLCKSKE